MPPKSLIILADDLTGAADSAARCRQAGLPATIFVQPPQLPLPKGAVAFTSDSRHLPADRAAQRVRELIEPLRTAPDVLWYKKIDSTLRGNLGAELDALLGSLASGLTAPRVLISPAFPAQGRGLYDGMLVHDQLDSEPPHLPSLLAGQTARPLAHIDLDSVRADREQLAARLDAAAGAGAELLVVDALDERDLRQIVDAAHAALPNILFCGSAGLVGVLAEGLAAPRSMVAPPLPIRCHKILVVVGSGSAMAHRQLETLRAAGTAHMHELTAHGLAGRPDRQQPEKTGTWLLHLPKPEPSTPLEGATARKLVARLARVAGSLMRELQPEALVLVGGDTAIEVMTRLGVRRLNVERELLPGIPLTRGCGHDNLPRVVVLKAGNFGDAQTLVRLVEMLQ